MNNAKFALVIAERPQFDIHREPDPVQKWIVFLANIQRVEERNPAKEKIHENIWLIALNTGMPLLTELLDRASVGRVPLHILFLDEEPAWIKHPQELPLPQQ